VDKYRTFLKPGGIIHLKTDSDLLFESTVEQVEENKYTSLLSTWDLYEEVIADLDGDTREILEIKTHYEKLFTSKGFKIKYCKFLIH
jgi:tRNA (guanine-N7-)-methyltransferase